MSPAGAGSTPLQKQFKPKDVEELIDYYLHRPVAAVFVFALARTPLSANQVTVLSGMFGILAGGAVAVGVSKGAYWVAIGGVLAFISVILDCADGQLARLRGQSSLVGRALDGVVDVIAPICVFNALAVYLWSTGLPWYWAWGLGIVAGASHARHSVIYDHVKNIYLNNTQPEYKMGISALASFAEIDREHAAYLARGERVNAWLVRAFRFYTEMQRNSMAEDREDTRPIAETLAERESYRAMFQPLMRWATFLGIGTHMFLLVLGCLLAPVSEWLVIATWLVMAVPLNAVALYVQRGRARLTAAFLARRDALRSASVS
jgi:phosphatidylglycerophosphate synthase